jgi:hypothetical protein
MRFLYCFFGAGFLLGAGLLLGCGEKGGTPMKGADMKPGSESSPEREMKLKGGKTKAQPGEPEGPEVPAPGKSK